MKNIKIYPLSIAYIISLLFLLVINCLMGYFIVLGILDKVFIITLIGAIGLVGFAYFEIKLISWHITFYEDYIYVPSSLFDKYLFGRKRIQRIYYSQIKDFAFINKVTQIIVCTCYNSKEKKMIYAKQFSKKQVQVILNEIKDRLNYVSKLSK